MTPAYSSQRYNFDPLPYLNRMAALGMDGMHVVYIRNYIVHNDDNNEIRDQHGIVSHTSASAGSGPASFPKRLLHNKIPIIIITE